MLVTRNKVQKLMPRDGEASASFDGIEQVHGSVNSVMTVSDGQFDRIILELQSNTHYHLAVHARWSMHQLIRHLLGITGPAEVWLTSWSITEQPVRELLDLMNKGLITSLSGVFDERTKVNNPNALQLARVNLSRIALTKIHAKCVVLINEEYSVTVISSANLTRNKRAELYVITTHKEVAEFHAGWIAKMFAQ